MKPWILHYIAFSDVERSVFWMFHAYTIFAGSFLQRRREGPRVCLSTSPVFLSSATPALKGRLIGLPTIYYASLASWLLLFFYSNLCYVSFPPSACRMVDHFDITMDQSTEMRDNLDHYGFSDLTVYASNEISI
jgi:hypothetical protein